MDNKQTIYDTKDVAEHLQIHASTVRKYCDFLEKAGYYFHKNEHGHRGFFDDNVIALKKLMEYKDAMSLEKASKSVVAWKTGIDVADSATEKERYITQYSELLNEFKTFKEHQESFNKELLQQLKSQQEYINTKLEERDQQLLNVLNQSLETQKQLASGEGKKWWKFWRKK